MKNHRTSNINGIIFSTRQCPPIPTIPQQYNRPNNYNNADNDINNMEKINRINQDLNMAINNNYNGNIQQQQQLYRPNRIRISAIQNRQPVIPQKNNNSEHDNDIKNDDIFIPVNQKHHTKPNNNHHKPQKININCDNKNSIKAVYEKIDVLDAEHERKIYSIRKRIHFMKKTIDDNSNEIFELNKKIKHLYNHHNCKCDDKYDVSEITDKTCNNYTDSIKHCNDNYSDNVHKSHESCKNNSESSLDIEIQNMSLYEKVKIYNHNDKYIEAYGTYKIESLKITDMNGAIYISGLNINLCEYDAQGTIKIIDNNTNIFYDGVIIKDGDNLKYVMSGRPVIPIGICINVILMINCNLIKKSN